MSDVSNGAQWLFLDIAYNYSSCDFLSLNLVSGSFKALFGGKKKNTSFKCPLNSSLIYGATFGFRL